MGEVYQARHTPCLPPDDRRAIVTRAASPTSYDLWLVDLERATATRLTFDGLVAGGGGFGSVAIWSPDGGIRDRGSGIGDQSCASE